MYRSSLTLLLPVLPFAALACAEMEEPAPELPPVGGEECPHEWDWTDEQRRNIEAFTGGRDDVFAFNDCQRFLVGSRQSPAYGEVFAIFVGAEAARGDAGAAASGEDEAAVALVAARGSYPPLGIGRAGFYCLLMDGRPGPNARMAPAGPGADCLDPPLEEARPLYTIRRDVEGSRETGDGSAVPGVARWGFDGLPTGGAGSGNGHWVQYAILPCGDAVCYVGPTGPNDAEAGFDPPSPGDVLAAISGELPSDGEVRRVDGWHDAQFLADPAGPKGRPRPHPALLVGVLIPDPALGERTPEDFDAGWVRVAEVALSAPSGYEEKFNFAETTGSAYNVVELCSYSGEAPGRCAELPEEVDRRCRSIDPKDPGARRWRRRHVNAATGSTAYSCVKYRPRPGVDGELDVPGVVRWKWLAEDEEAWFACPRGCCAGVL
ncbi:MAG: hypothetical protein ACOC9N_01200 [Gemmatimonadota bacterium]